MTSYQSGLSISFITPALIRSRTLKKKIITIYLGLEQDQDCLFEATSALSQHLVQDFKYMSFMPL